MQNTIYPILFSVLSATSYGIESVATKKFSHVNSSYIVFFRSITSLIFSLIFLYIFRNTISFTAEGLLYTVIISVFFYLGLYLYTKSLARGSAGIMMSINSSKLLIVVFASYLFFNHTFSLNNLLSAIVIVLGLLLVGVDSISKGKILTTEGLKEGIISVIFGGIAATLAKIPISMIGVYLYAVIIQILFLSYSFINLKRNYKPEVFKELVNNSKLNLFYIGLFAALGFFFFNQALYFGDPSLVNGIMAGQIIVASLLEYLIFNKRLTRYKYLGILFVFIGIFTLAYYW